MAGPKTIEQIHKEVAREEKQQQLDNILTKASGGRDRDRGGPGGPRMEPGKRGSRGPGGGPAEADGWTAVPARPRATQPFEKVDTTKLRGMQSLMGKAMDLDNMQLGPGSRGPGGGFMSWGKGSAGSRNSQTKEDSGANASANRFAAFAGGAGGGASMADSEPYESRRGMAR